MPSRAPLSLKARAIGLLAQREHSRTELRRKLVRLLQQQAARAGNSPASRRTRDSTGRPDEDAPIEPEAFDEADTQAQLEAIEALLDSLVAEGYLSEARFVESRLHVRSNRFGLQRIQQELAQHGLKLEPAQQAALKSTELERAREVWHRRFGSDPATDADARARQTRFMLARGFGADVIRQLLRGAG